MKNFKKIMALVMAICVFSTSTTGVNAKINEYNSLDVKESNVSNLTDEFYQASDDTIVCYMDGIAIKKSQVDANGLINFDALNASSISASGPIVYATTTFSATQTIPTGITYPCSLNVSPYSNAIIKTTIVAPGYSQNNTKLYLSNLQGAQFASSIETPAGTTIVLTALGFIPIVGPAITISFTILALRNAEVAGQIRSYTNYGKKVRINVATSSYGTFYGVSEWTGTVAPMVELTSTPNGGTETLNNVHVRM